MGKLRRVLRCNHCGEILQDKDINKPGYIPKLDYGKEIDRILYCESCFQKRKVNRGELASQVDLETYSILSKAKKEESIVLFVCDAICFNGIIKEQIVDIIKNLDVVVIVNKIDLLPINKNNNNIKQFIKDRFAELGINVVETYLISLKTKKEDISMANNEISKIAIEKNIYLIGDRLSGKTSLVNEFLKQYQNKTKRYVTTVNLSNSDNKILAIPIADNYTLYELKGFALDDSMLGLVEKNTVNKYIVNKQIIKPRKVRLNQGQCFVFGALGMICLNSGITTDFTIYMNNNIDFKKLSFEKEKAFLKTNLALKKVLPIPDNASDFSSYDLFEYDMENDNEIHEIGIKGLGFITFKGQGQKIYIMVIKGTGIKEGSPRLC